VRGLHAPESPLLFDVRDGHVPSFSGLGRWGRGLRRPFFGWVVLVTARVATRRRLRRNPPVSSAGTVLDFLLVYSIIELFIGLDARSVSLLCARLCFIVKRGLKSVLCNVYFIIWVADVVVYS
jgi:hypothetical protein